MGVFKKMAYNMMVLSFRIRDLLDPPENIIEKFDIKEGYRVLDYGCGYGSHSIAAAGAVGARGKVYAADISGEAIGFIRRAMESNANIEAIRTGCRTNLPEKSIDVVFLFDVYHLLGKPGQIMKELYRVLKDEGILLFSDHHMKHEDILNEVTQQGFYNLSGGGNEIYSFMKGTQRG